MKSPRSFMIVVSVLSCIAIAGTIAVSAIALAQTVSTPSGANGATNAAVTSATASSTSLQAQVDADNAQIAILDQQIASYQSQLQKIGADKKTLQAAINTLDLRKNTLVAQEGITQHEINITQTQIEQLGGEINDTQQQISQDLSAVGAGLREVQWADSKPLLMQILSSGNVADIWNNVNANLQVSRAVQDDMKALQTQKNQLADSKSVSEQKQATLASQEQSLADQQQSITATAVQKNQLLAETNAKESTYQQLLANAEDEIKGFTAFVQQAGGAKLVGDQTICDTWGCYYNQRDSVWGSDSLNGTKYTLAEAGCLVTSVAMVMTHYGYRNVTPVTINSNPANFAVYYPAYLLNTIVVDGMTVSRKAATIDATLATGNPVIVGLYAYGGTHFVVFVSGSRGNYIMRDPYISNGKDISFSAHYSLNKVFSVGKVTINS